MRRSSYPRRQRNRRRIRAVQHAVLAVVGLALAGLAASASLAPVALSLLAVSLACSVHSARSLRLARRSAVGARSEQRVRAELRSLEHSGWRIQNSLRWRGGGDIDHLAIAPRTIGLAFPIETKTRTYHAHDLERITAIATWLVRRRSRWCHEGAIPVLCLAGTRGLERWEAGVAIVSTDRLVGVLSRLAGTTPKPGFLR